MTLQELGQAIREHREAAGLSIDDVAARIKISGRILRSIEDGSLVGLPHAVYTKSFIRVFGQLVGLNPEELNQHLEKLFPLDAMEENRTEGVMRPLPTTYPGTGKRLVALIVFLLVLGGLVGGGWYVTTQYGAAIWEIVKQPFSAITAPTGAPAEGQDNAAPGTGAAASSPGVSSTLSAIGQRGDAPGAPPTTASGATSPAPPAGMPNSDSPAPAGVNASEYSVLPEEPLVPVGKNRLLISASEACWMSSRADGARGRDYTLQPNESFVLTYTDSLELTLGNAGGVTLEHNGKNLGHPGGRGQRIVLRFPPASR